jgi:hypothetical protein
MPAARADREIVPNDGVLFEEVLEALRETQFAASVETREAQARDQDGHATPVDSQLARVTSGHSAVSAPSPLTLSPNLTASSGAKDRTSHRLDPDHRSGRTTRVLGSTDNS